MALVSGEIVNLYKTQATRIALVSGEIVNLYKVHGYQDGLSLW